MFRYPDLPSRLMVAIVLKESNQMRHVGILYRESPASAARICHLEGHYKISHEDFNDPNYFCESTKLSSLTLKYLIAALKKLTDLNKSSVPYGFKMPFKVYDDGKRYVGNTAGEGLTCATFVISIFEANGLEFLDKDSWEIRDDDIKWQERIVEYFLNSGFIDQQHAIAAKDLIGKVVRFRPEEVYVTATSDKSSWKIVFSDAKKMAEEILEHLKKAS